MSNYTDFQLHLLNFPTGSLRNNLFIFELLNLLSNFSLTPPYDYLHTKFQLSNFNRFGATASTNSNFHIFSSLNFPNFTPVPRFLHHVKALNPVYNP